MASLQVAPAEMVTLRKADLEAYIDVETQSLYDHMKRLQAQHACPDRCWHFMPCSPDILHRRAAC